MDLSVSTKRQTPKTDLVLAAQDAFGAELPVDSFTSAKRPKLQSNSGLEVPDNKPLGSGSFGAVYTYVDEKTQQVLAVKKVDLGMVNSYSYQKKIDHAMKEVKMMEKLKHHHRIVSYIKHELISDGLFPDKKILCIYMEYMPGGSVSSRLYSAGAFSEKEARRCMRQILEGLSYLHSRRLIHRDVKGSNVLFDANNDLKLADFGVSKQLNELSTFSARTNTGQIGTPKWMAPEVVADKEYNKKADIWSAGATMVEMLTQNPPWPKLTAMQWMFKLSQQQKPEYSLPPSISKTAQNFLNDMFNYDDRIRPTSEQLLGHPWFKTQEIDSLSEKKKKKNMTLADQITEIIEKDRKISPPQALTLVKSRDFRRNDCWSVHGYRGITYAGFRGSLYRMNEDGTANLCFLIRGWNCAVWSISVHNNRIYTLSSDLTVRVHDLEGRPITSWIHTDKQVFFVNQLSIINDRITIPDKHNRTLVFYSWNGKVVNTLPCPLLTNTPLHLCAADNNSIIISQCDSSLVYKVDTSSGDIIWQCKDVATPRGVTCYRDEFVLVADVTKPTSLCVLSSGDGLLLRRIPVKAGISDLHATGSTLALALGERVEVYKIK